MNQINRRLEANRSGTARGNLQLVHPSIPTVTQPTTEADFDVMRRAFFIYGGMPSGDEVLRLARMFEDVPISAVAMPIATRRVVSVAYRGALLLPNFQFEPGTLRVRGPVSTVISELRAVRDDWHLALWFALPSAALGGTRPVDGLDERPLEICAAARAERIGRCG